jgi:hypothetical protein
MIDDFETRVGLGLQRIALPAAPASLRSRVQEIAAVSPHARGRRGRGRDWRWVMLVAAAVALLATAGGALFLSGGSSLPATIASPSPTTTIQPSKPSTVDGLPLLTVSEAIAKRDAGDLDGGPVAIGGYWSDASVQSMCVPPNGTPGVLELWCGNGEFGITELAEPIETISNRGHVTPGTGPSLTPYIGNDLAGASALFTLPIINGQRYTPIPIVIVGHFDDPRATICRPEARQLCKDRLVVDRIVQFDPSSVPTPAPTPSPTPFPFADPPPAMFDAAACSGNIPYGFVGWTTLAALGINQGYPNETGFAMITRDAVPIGGWTVDPSGGGKWRMWGRRLCIAFPEEPGVISSNSLPGSMFKEWSDGHHEPYESPST